jgi:cell division protein FtsB
MIAVAYDGTCMANYYIVISRCQPVRREIVTAFEGCCYASEMREIRQLRDENAQLKRRVADLPLDKHILSEVSRKKV